MSSKDWFETFLRARVRREVSDFDLENAWVRLQHRRRERRRRRIFLFWLFAVVAGGGLLGYWQWGKNNNISAATNQVYQKNGQNEIEQVLKPQTTGAGALHITNKPPSVKFKNKTPENQSVIVTSGSKKEILENIPTEKMPETVVSGNSDQLEEDYSGDSKNTFVADVSTAPLSTINWESTAMLPGIVLQPVYHATQPEFQHFDVNSMVGPKRAKYPKWLIGAEVGYGLQFANRSSSDNAWLAYRDGQEETLDFFTANITLRHYLSPRWFIQPGIGWTRFVDRRTFATETSVTEIKPNQLVQIIIKADGTEEKIFSDAPVTTLTRIEGVQHNRFNRLELPIVAGMEFFSDSKIGFSAAAGLIPCLAGKLEGGVADSTFDGTLSLANASYRASGLLAGLVKLELSVHLPHGILGLSVQGRADLLNAAKSDALFTEKRNAIGLALGYCYFLDKKLR